MSDLEGRLRAALQDETADLTARSELADDMVSRGMSVRRRRRAAGGIAGLVVLAAAFPVWRSIDTSSGPVPPVGSPTPTVVTHAPPRTTTTPTTPTTPTQTTTTTPLVWSTDPVQVTNVLSRATHVIDLRVGQHDTYDRVVIDFDGELPSYDIRYVSALTYDGSGATVPLDGQRFIQISLTPAQGHDDQANPLYHGPHLTPYAFPTLVGAVLLGDFEGTVSFGLAVNHHAGFLVSTQPLPNRLIIDIQH